MAQRIASAGWECTVWARRPQALDPFRRGPARLVASPAELGQGIDLLCCCVFDAAGTREVLLGSQGAAPSMPRGAAIAIHSTIAPHEVRDLAAEVRRLGLDLVDAPVSGGPARAARGDLVTMVGADTHAWTRYQQVFEAFSSLVVEVGRVGDGQLAKLVNNAMLVAHMEIAHEAFEIVERLGLSRSALEQALLHGSGRSRGAQVLVGAGGLDGIARSPVLRILAKDVRLLVEAFADEGVVGDRDTAADAMLVAAAQRAITCIEGRRK